MRHGLERPLAELLDEYAAQAAHTDEVVASSDLDAGSVRNTDTGTPSRCVMHLIEEAARTTATWTSSANSPAGLPTVNATGVVDGGTPQVTRYRRLHARGVFR
jgi:hypothetical protein